MSGSQGEKLFHNQLFTVFTYYIYGFDIVWDVWGMDKSFKEPVVVVE